MQKNKNQEFCLVLALWGDAFHEKHVNTLVDSVKKSSPQLREVILLTDRLRPMVDASVRQIFFPEDFSRPEFFEKGYRVKISVFSSTVLPPSMTCIYLDLDTMVTGNIGRLADLIKSPSDIFMLPPGNIISFGTIRRLFFKFTNGKHFATGNSSIMAYHSSMTPNIADVFLERFQSGDRARYMSIDDVFISWAGQLKLRGMPTSLAVTFRREFLSRFKLEVWWRKISPFRRKHRNSLVAITFNGMQYKHEELLRLKMGDKISDAKGRLGYWSDEHMGPLRARIIEYCYKIKKI